MPSAASACVMVVVACIVSARAAGIPVIPAPTISAEGNEGKIYADATDLVLRSTDDGSEISVLHLSGTVAVMTGKIATLEAALAAVRGTSTEAATLSLDDVATKDGMANAIDAAAAALQSELLGDTAAKSKATNARVDQLVKDLAGFDETKKTVGALAKDVAYVLSHTANATACAADGTVHAGDGECVDPIPSCPKPQAPTNQGVMTLSSTFIIPGVTATYTCPKEGTFLLGPDTRTCLLKTGKFDATDPDCKDCNVLNCKLCAGAQDTCGKCSYGHDLSANKKACEERKDTVFVLEGGVPNARHSYRSLSMLPPNGGSWQNVFPSMPFSATNAAGSIIKGTIYYCNEDYRSRTGVYYKLAPGSTKWVPFPGMGGGADVTPSSFFATINGQSTKADGFYVFSKKSSYVGASLGAILKTCSARRARN